MTTGACYDFYLSLDWKLLKQIRNKPLCHDKVAVSKSETFTTTETLQKHALSVILGPTQ